MGFNRNKLFHLMNLLFSYLFFMFTLFRLKDRIWILLLVLCSCICFLLFQMEVVACAPQIQWISIQKTSLIKKLFCSYLSVGEKELVGSIYKLYRAHNVFCWHPIPDIDRTCHISIYQPVSSTKGVVYTFSHQNPFLAQYKKGFPLLSLPDDFPLEGKTSHRPCYLWNNGILVDQSILEHSKKLDFQDSRQFVSSIEATNEIFLPDFISTVVEQEKFDTLFRDIKFELDAPVHTIQSSTYARLTCMSQVLNSEKTIYTDSEFVWVDRRDIKRIFGGVRDNI